MNDDATKYICVYAIEMKLDLNDLFSNDVSKVMCYYVQQLHVFSIHFM